MAYECVYTEAPKIATKNMILMIGPSMCGKSSLLRNILLEEEQFENKISKLIYIYSMECENVQILKKKFPKKGTFLKHIPGKIERERERDRQRDRQTDRKTDRLIKRMNFN